MIDYEKLKEAHELCKKSNGYYFILQYNSKSENAIFTLCHPDKFDENDFSIHDLITKLKELTQPKPKYKVGDEVWIINYYNNSPELKNIMIIREHLGHYLYVFEKYNGSFDVHSGSDFELTEEDIFSTKQELIQSKIDYWQSQLINEELKDCNIQLVEYKECQHESDGVLYTSHPPQYKCKKCRDYYK